MSKVKSGMKSLFTIAKNAAKGIDQSVPKEIEEARLAVCESCPKLMVTKQCGECLCFVKAKTMIRQENCPMGKWKEWTTEEKH